MNGTIWVIEDHRRLRQTVCEALSAATSGQVTGFPSCEAAISAVTAGRQPDVVLLDLALPGMSGLEGLRILKQLVPESQIIMFTVSDDRSHVFEAVCGGASGYLLKSEPLDRIVSAVEEVRRGGAPMTAEIARTILDRFSLLAAAGGPPEDPVPPAAKQPAVLSDREREVLRLLADGRTKKEIAATLDLSQHTVDNYVRRIYGKLHVNNLGGAVARAIRDGIM